MLRTLAAATLALATLVGPAAAQDASANAIVNAQLDAATTEIGLTSEARVYGRLAEDRAEIVRIEAAGGDLYFIGACDRNCRDVDLIVRDASGRELGRDFEPDDVPIVSVPGATAGRYTVEVWMATCAGECDWGVGVFR